MSDCSDEGVTRQIASMKTGGQFFASGTEGCVCSTNVVNGVSMQIYPTVYDLSSDDAMKDTGFYRTVHEYVHVWQSMAAGSAGWLMEGTAVFTECVMGLKHLQQDWKGCLEQLGGGGGILRNARKMVSYAVSDGFGVTASDWLKIYGEFRPKAGEELDMLEKSNPSVLGGGPGLGRMVYYDLGAAAVAFAITKHVGLAADASVSDFYRVFYPSIKPVDDMQFVGDGQGWKKALLDFTGLRSMDDFYEELTMWLELPDGPMWTVLENGGLGAAAVSAALANGTYAPPSDQEWPIVSVVEATCAPAPGPTPGPAPGPAPAPAPLAGRCQEQWDAVDVAFDELEGPETCGALAAEAFCADPRCTAVTALMTAFVADDCVAAMPGGDDATAQVLATVDRYEAKAAACGVEKGDRKERTAKAKAEAEAKDSGAGRGGGGAWAPALLLSLAFLLPG